MHLCEGWVWENAYSSLKSMETATNLCIILFNLIIITMFKISFLLF